MSGLLKNRVAGIAKDMLAAKQHEIGKLNAQLAAMPDGDEATDRPRAKALGHWAVPLASRRGS